MIRTIKNDVSAEIVVKKSKFIANIFYVENEVQAQEKIKEVCKKYHDAKHNCYAYFIQEINGENINQIQKSSDNGEPSGTAGAPLLDVLKKKEICNAIIIVTRYFGGILLGTGGLVKAYTESATNAIEKTEIIKKEIGNRYEVELQYSDVKEFNYTCNSLEINTVETLYKENVIITIETSKEIFEKLPKTKIINYKIIKENNWISKSDSKQ